MLTIIVTLVATGVSLWLILRARDKNKLTRAKEWRAYRRRKKEAGDLNYVQKPWHPEDHYGPRLWAVWVGTITAGAVAFGVATVLALPIVAWVGEGGNYRQLDSGSAPIVRLADGTGQLSEGQGSFFLGIGSFVENGYPILTYSWYERSEGGLRGRLISDDGFNEIKVVETDAERPHYQWFDGEDPCHSPFWLTPFHELCGPIAFQREWTLYVPRGSVARGFELNAE